MNQRFLRPHPPADGLGAAPGARSDAAGAAPTTPPDDAHGVEGQLRRIRWVVWLVMGLLAASWLAYGVRSHRLALQEQQAQAKIAATSVRAQLDNALRHMDDILAYTSAAFVRHGAGLIDSDTLAQVRGRELRNPYRQVLITNAVGEPMLSIPAPPLDAPLQAMARAQSANTSGTILSHVVHTQGQALLARSMRLTQRDGRFAGMAVALLDPALVRDALNTSNEQNAWAMQLLLGAQPVAKGWGSAPAPVGAPVYTLATAAPDLSVQAWVQAPAVRQAWLAQLWWPSFFMCCLMALFLWGSRNLSRSLRQELDHQRLADQRAIEARVHAMFLANISHEIRTPLNGVLGACDLLVASRLDAQQTELIGLMRRSGENLMAIINDILDFSKLQAGHFELETKPFALLPHLQDSCAHLAPLAESKGLALRHALELDAADWVASDPVRLRQIVHQLLGNAIKFTESGEVVLSAQWQATPPARQLHLRVQDTGIGMDAQQLQRLYNPFQQADSSHARRYGGTGLGLSITQHLVALLGGRLSVQSALGQGTVFELWLPMPAVPAETSIHPEPSTASAVALALPCAPAPGLHAPAPTKVLVVEDHPVNQTIIQAMLERLGCAVDMAGNGLQALNAFETQMYDLVLMDCQMPEMDGFEATRAIRRREAVNPTLGRVPVIALTALAMQGDAERCLAAGMDDYLTKPIQLEQLSAKLQHWRGRDAMPLAPAPTQAQ